MKDVIVVGAGIAGLTLAYRLQRAGRKVIVLESSANPGGWIQTTQKDGFTLECGPNSCSENPAFLELVKDLDIESELVSASSESQKRYIVSKDKLVPVPQSFTQALFTPIISTTAKIRLLAEPFMPRSKENDESVYSFVKRRAGEQFATNIMSAALNGIWAGDINSLSARSALNKLWGFEQEHGSLVMGSTKSSKKNIRKIYSFKTGMGRLVERLMEVIEPGTVRLLSEVHSIEIVDDYYTLKFDKVDTNKAISGKNVVLTTPTKTTLELLKKYNLFTRSKVEKIPYAPIGILHLAFPKGALGEKLDGFGFLSPSKADQAVLGAIYSSTIFPNRAAEDCELLTCFTGGLRNPELANVFDEQVRDKAIEEINSLLDPEAHPRVIGAHFYQDAIPNYPINHYELQEEIETLNYQDKGIKILSNWFSGVSVGDRIEEARLLADKLAI